MRAAVWESISSLRKRQPKKKHKSVGRNHRSRSELLGEGVGIPRGGRYFRWLGLGSISLMFSVPNRLQFIFTGAVCQWAKTSVALLFRLSPKQYNVLPNRAQWQKRQTRTPSGIWGAHLVEVMLAPSIESLRSRRNDAALFAWERETAACNMSIYPTCPLVLAFSLCLLSSSSGSWAKAWLKKKKLQTVGPEHTIFVDL